MRSPLMTVEVALFYLRVLAASRRVGKFMPRLGDSVRPPKTGL